MKKLLKLIDYPLVFSLIITIQKEGFLPEPHTDFIMSIVSEELGIIGVLIILTIVLCSFKIAQECKNQFGRCHGNFSLYRNPPSIYKNEPIVKTT
ncbi:FtsW/RodA/SpoVE family cell cycle protein [Bacillus paramycoides]|uniref:FtsW/RodA/SpoVE family cell cycle protein n=1 Tax=Bacillus paramycoides TaxID=2026194 RepID=UPI0035E462FB